MSEDKPMIKSAGRHNARARLNEALRANLKRRKAAPKPGLHKRGKQT